MLLNPPPVPNFGYSSACVIPRFARRIDSSYRVPDIVILGQRGSDQLLELLVLQDFEPFGDSALH